MFANSLFSGRLRPVLDSRVALLVAYVLAIVVKAPVLFSAPRFWAEAGVVYFLQARSLPFWQALWAKPLGYLSLPANLGGIASASLPLLYAPYGDLAVSLMVQLVLFWVVVANGYFDGNRLKQFFLLAIPILVIQSSETWLNSINGQFWLALGAGYVVASPTRKFSANCHAANFAALAFAALAGVVASFLTPLFILRALLERRWIWLAYAGVVAIGAALMVLGHGGQGRTLDFPLSLFAISSFFQLALDNLCMPCAVWLFPHTGIIKSAPFVGLSLLAIAAAVAVILVRASNTGRWLLLASLSLLLLSFAGMLGKELIFSAQPYFSSRYFFAPAALFFGALLFVREGKAHRLAGLVLAVFALNGAYFLIRYPVVGQDDGKRWTDSVRGFYAQRAPVIYFTYPSCGFSPTLAGRTPMAPAFAALSPTEIVFDVPGLGSSGHPSVYLYRAQRGRPGAWQRSNETWADSGLFLMGTTAYGQCYGGDSPLPVTWIAIRGDRLIIDRARLGDLAGDTFLLGYGENFASMLANKTFTQFSGDDLLAHAPDEKAEPGLR